MSQLGTPIAGGLNFNPSGAGNPYLGILAGPAGLAAQYGQSYNNSLQANQQNYNNILGGYQTVMNNVGNTLGQGGTPWGVAAPAAQAINDVYHQQAGGAFQNSINRGLGNTTAASASQRGAALDANKAYAGLGSQLASTYAGYEANLGQGQLNFMNSVNIPYPNGQDYSTLYQQYGAQQANAANSALLQQAQRQSMYAANSGHGLQPGSGPGTPQMPGVNRGGGVSGGSNAAPGLSANGMYGADAGARLTSGNWMNGVSPYGQVGGLGGFGAGVTGGAGANSYQTGLYGQDLGIGGASAYGTGPIESGYGGIGLSVGGEGF